MDYTIEYEDKRVGFYPLIILRTTTTTSSEGKTWKNRRVIRNRQFDNRWYAPALPALFGRQVGKLLAYKGKSLMELPYSLETCETMECEAQYLEYSPNTNAPQSRKIEADVEAIIDAELEGV